MTIDELFQTIAEKTTNNENISVELNDLMTSVKSLQGVNTQQEQQIKELQDYNSKLKDANSNLLLSKGFVSRFEKEPEPELEEDKPRNIKDFIKFD